MVFKSFWRCLSHWIICRRQCKNVKIVFPNQTQVCSTNLCVCFTTSRVEFFLSALEFFNEVLEIQTNLNYNKNKKKAFSQNHLLCAIFLFCHFSHCKKNCWAAVTKPLNPAVKTVGFVLVQNVIESPGICVFPTDQSDWEV